MKPLSHHCFPMRSLVATLSIVLAGFQCACSSVFDDLSLKQEADEGGAEPTTGQNGAGGLGAPDGSSSPPDSAGAGAGGGGAGATGSADAGGGGAGATGGGSGSGGSSGSSSVDSGPPDAFEAGVDSPDARGSCPEKCPVSAPACSTGACRRVVQVSVGGLHACLLLDDGTVRCWGSNNVGQLGDGTLLARLTPGSALAVIGLSDVTRVASGFGHSCAVTKGGSVWCWGHNGYGQLGHLRSGAEPVPLQVTGLEGPVAEVGCHGLAGYGGGYTCARMVSGKVRCWGSNSAGELGNGTRDPSSAPVEVASLLDATQIAVGERATCALRRTGNVMCWGNNEEGMLAVGSDAPYVTAPQEVVGLSDVRMVSGGAAHFCAIVGEAGTVKCWGSDYWGALGDGLPMGAPSKIVVDVALTAVEEVRAGFRSSCARLRSGAVRCWGNNFDGLQGIGSVGEPAAAPTTSALLSSAAAALDLRWEFACASLTSGELQCWGDNQAGAVGNGQVSGKVFAPASVLW